MRIITTLLLWSFTTAFLTAQRSTSSDLETAAQEVTITPNGGTLSERLEIIVSFPSPRIPLDQIGLADAPAPLVFTPALEGDFQWDSTSTGKFIVTGPIIPGQVYTLDLPDNQNPTWKPVLFESDPLEVTTRYYAKGKALPAQPEVDLQVNYPVKPADVIRSVHFQNRATRTKHDAAILLPQIETQRRQDPVDQPEELLQFSVTPTDPLPIGATYDLIIDGLVDARTNTPIPAVKAVNLGSTQALEILEVELYTHPLEKPAVLLLTSAPVDHDTLEADSVTVTPVVQNLTFFATNDFVRLQGDFDTSETYQITLGDAVKSTTDYPLSNPGPHDAVFDGFSPVIVFPQAQFYQRCALGLNVTVMQSNCPETTWRLAQIPFGKLSVVQDRLKEFEGAEKDPFSGEHLGQYQTELLTEALFLPVTAQGTLPGAGKHESLYRDIRWKPEDGQIDSGAYLLESTATLEDGRVVGNRSILFFNELVIHRRFTPEELILKVFTMDAGKPVVGAKVEIIDAYNIPLADGQTDAEGSFRVSRDLTEPNRSPKASYILLRSSLGGGVQPYRGARFAGSGWVGRRSSHSDTSQLVGEAFADRNLYRPGDPMHVKGTFRWRDTDRSSGAYTLSSHTGTVDWSVRQGYNGPTLASGESMIDNHGGWEATWTPPKSSKLGNYQFRYGTGNFRHSVSFQVEEYKPPLFKIELTEDKADPTQPSLQIASHYFHGAANAGAHVRWKINWSEHDYWNEGFQENDAYSPRHRERPASILREGEFRLDAKGLGRIDLKLPFEQPLSAGRYVAYTSVEVLSPEGQVMEAVKEVIVTPNERFPSIKWSRASDDEPDNPDLLVHPRAQDREGKVLTGIPMDLTIYHMETQTVKERLGPQVYRYRNFPRFERLQTLTVTSGQPHRFTPTKTGHYVAYARLKEKPNAVGVSDRIHSLGEGVGRYHVSNDGEITLLLDKERYVAGEDTAQIAVETPFGGQAWVCVETDRVVDQFLVDLPENNQAIALPIKPAYHPNVHATVYLLRPGGSDHLPLERYGSVSIEVDRPDLELDVTPELLTSDVQPGDQVRGIVKVICQGEPVSSADITVFAVDSAVHRLGEWQMPDWFARMYPRRYLNVAAHRGLGEHFERFEERDVTEKGFLIGGGGSLEEAAAANTPMNFRKDFRALAFWKTQLETNVAGEAEFSFQAPDNLTSFHLVAIAQTPSHQFGQGDTTFKVSKRLMVEPALTRFVRKGDIIDLRAVVRQDYVENATVMVRCEVSGEFEWLSNVQELPLSLTKGLPQVVRFPCRILGGDAIQVRFQAHGEDHTLHDAAEITLPVRSAGIVQRTGHFGVIPGEVASFPIHEKLPEHWLQAEGSFGLTVSHTPYLPELSSLPEVLDYPHGCLEQKSTRYLSYALMTDLLDYLPELKDRHANYAERLQEGLETYNASMLSNGFIPYWEGSSRPNDWVTVMAYWLKETVKQHGMAIPPRLDEGLTKALGIIARGQRTSPSISLTARAFALFTHAETGHVIGEMEPLLTDLYARRADLSFDGLTLLTLAMNRYDVMAKEQGHLGKALAMEAGEIKRPFDPSTFGSPHRDQVLRWLTRVRLSTSHKAKQELSQAYLKESEAKGNPLLSTQEHFWRTLLLKEMIQLDAGNAFPQEGVQPQPDFTSAKRLSLSWKRQPLEQLQELALELGTGKKERYYLMQADVTRDAATTEEAEDRGFRLERVVTNLTNATRTGEDHTPYAIGDELLLTYRFEAKLHQHYVALTDELPAGIEAVNFNLPQLAVTYELPAGTKATLSLSHNELRDQSANLYFDDVPVGHHTYAILARVTAEGSFAWPPSQITPMYQPYVSGLTPARVAHTRNGL